MRYQLMTVVLAALAASVSTPAQVGVRFDRAGVRIHVDQCARPAPVRTRVAGHWRRVWVPPEYGYRVDRCGRRVRVVLRAGRWERVWVRGPRFRRR